MYILATIVQYAAYVAVLIIAFVFAKSWWTRQRAELQYTASKRRVGSTRTWQDPDAPPDNVVEAVRASLKFLGLPSIHGSGTILNVPTFLPNQEGWDSRRTVITASRVTAQMKQGPVPGDFVELDGNYALFGVNGKHFLLQAHNLTTAEESYLEGQRRDAVEKGDGIIEDFQGAKWRIGTACGSHANPRRGEKSTSTIQVLSTHPGLNTGEVNSCLPPNLLDGAEHDYFDMRAKSLDGEERVLFFFYAGGTWSCFMGRELTGTERDRLQAL